jgi:hypothetical protein
MDLLHRPADSSGLAHWTGQLKGGAARSDVVQQIVTSPEYRANEVQALYAQFLGRSADVDGLNNFVDLLDSGDSVEQVTEQILGSQEYFQNRAGGNNATFLTALYHDVLGRAVDPTGIRSFQQPLMNGISRDAVVGPVLTSPEAVQRQLDILYQRYLFRPPDSVGENLFAKAMQQNTSTDAVIVALTASSEYLKRITAQGAAVPALTVRYTPVVEKLFEQFYGREATPQEVTLWVGRFAAAADDGLRITAPLLQFLNSSESLQTLVASWHQHYLSQTLPLAQLKLSPDVTSAATLLVQGSDFNTVLADLLAGEGFYQQAGSTDSSFLAALYQVVLNRQPTGSELSDGLSKLAGGSRQGVIRAVLDGSENIRNEVTQWYKNYLGRTQTPQVIQAQPDFGFWVNRLQEYGDPFAVLSEFLASQEYLGFRPDLFDQPNVGWNTPPGPFAQPVAVQRGAATTFHSGSPVVATTYFYWYDVTSGNNVFTSAGQSALTHHPPTLTGFSYLNVDWHEQQLRDMTDAGIDVALAVSYSSPFSDPDTNDPTTIDSSLLFTDQGLSRLVTARHRLLQEGVQAPAIGMFYDTTSLSGGNYNPQRYQVDLRTDGGKRWLYESIRNFFSHVPAADWALIDGKPLIFLYHLGFGAGVDENVVPFVRAQFRQDFGVDCYIVAPDETLAPGIAFSSASQPWSDLLHQEPAYTVLADLLAGNEFYAAGGGTDGGFVDRLYNKILNRPADAFGRSAWIAALQTESHRQVVDQFLNSTEALRTLVAGWFKHFLRRLEPLNVLAGSHELDPWVARLQDGEDMLSVLASLLAGPSFYAASGGTDAALVDNLYQQVLLRPSDAAGKASWLDRLKHQTRAHMIVDFLRSDEAYQVLAGGWVLYDLGHYYPGPVDAQYSWGGAINAEFRDVAEIGPGYDQSAAKTRSPLIVPRNGGQLYRQNWETLLAMNPRPWLVNLETWDELIEGSDICETKEFGRTYIDITRQFADIFHHK